MSVQFGGGSKTKPQTTTQTRNVAPPTAGEGLLQQVNERLAQAQAQEAMRAMTAQQSYEQSAPYMQAQQLGQQAGGLLQQDMAGGQLLSSPQQAALQQYFQSIMQPQMEQMRQVAGQEAARRGMTISDSPIGGDFLRNLAGYQAQMGGQQAGQALQLQQNNRGLYQNQMNMGNQLAQNAAQNRMALSQMQPGSFNFGNQLAQQRIASAPMTSITSGGATSQAPRFGIGANDLIGGAQGALNLWGGTYKGSTPGLKSLFPSSEPPSEPPLGYKR
mgnify:CR=1 FL=1